MSRNNDDGIFVLLGILAIVGILAFVVWKFSSFFGFDMSTGGAVLIRLVCLAVLIGLCWKFGDDFEPIRLGNTWPILLAVLWFCWWPALDYWASQQRPAFFTQEEVNIWWAAWYTKAGGFFGITGLGFLAKKLF